MRTQWITAVGSRTTASCPLPPENKWLDENDQRCQAQLTTTCYHSSPETITSRDSASGIVGFICNHFVSQTEVRGSALIERFFTWCETATLTQFKDNICEQSLKHHGRYHPKAVAWFCRNGCFLLLRTAFIRAATYLRCENETIHDISIDLEDYSDEPRNIYPDNIGPSL